MLHDIAFTTLHRSY